MNLKDELAAVKAMHTLSIGESTNFMSLLPGLTDMPVIVTFKRMLNETCAVYALEWCGISMGEALASINTDGSFSYVKGVV